MCVYWLVPNYILLECNFVPSACCTLLPTTLLPGGMMALEILPSISREARKGSDWPEVTEGDSDRVSVCSLSLVACRPVLSQPLNDS